jgi:hypothetical protein
MLAAITRDFDALAGVDLHLTWTQRLRAALLAIHVHNQQHPVLAELLVTDAPRPLQAYRTTEQLIGLLVEAGFNRNLSVDIVGVIQLQLSGLLLLEARSARDGREPAVEARRAELRLLDLPASDFPNIIASVGHVARVDTDVWRTLAIDIIVGGVAGLLAESAKSS